MKKLLDGLDIMCIVILVLLNMGGWRNGSREGLRSLFLWSAGSSPVPPTIFSGRKYFRSRKPVCLVVMNSYRKANGGKKRVPSAISTLCFG